MPTSAVNSAVKQPAGASALGTLPDLDVVMRPWLTNAEFILSHRGLSHGLLTAMLGAIPLTWLLRTCHHLSWARAYPATSLIWLTHILIDCLTSMALASGSQ